MPVWNPHAEELGGNTEAAITNSKVLLWQGHCSVHAIFRPEHVDAFREANPDGIVVAHPESSNEVCEKADQVGSTDFIIKAVTGLLLMSVLIALIGIINTMSLSILERRRELGLLRIIGMTDKRVQRMVRLESVLISLLGTVTGLVAGVVVSLALLLSINRLGGASVSPSFPGLELLGILVAGVVLGVLAALVPARRSTRLEVLDAVQAT